jgi:DNA-binding NarL/FixJ family response regulator
VSAPITSATTGPPTPDARVRVLFVDDNALAAQALQRFMQARADVALVGWASDAEDALDRTRRDRPDVVLLDLEMPGVDTMALIPHLEAADPGVRIAMFSGHCRAEDIERALGAGATGYICKDEPTSVIVDMVVRAAAGECALSPLAERTFLGGH